MRNSKQINQATNHFLMGQSFRPKPSRKGIPHTIHHLFQPSTILCLFGTLPSSAIPIGVELELHASRDAGEVGKSMTFRSNCSPWSNMC